jgi:hypothetical protein
LASLLTLQAPPLTKKASRATLFRLPGNGKSVVVDDFWVIAEVKSLTVDASFVIADAFFIDSDVDTPLR